MRLRVPIISILKKYWTASLRHTEIAALELEFYKVTSKPSYNAARASEIISSLAKLYQTELAEGRGSTPTLEEAPPSPPLPADMMETELPRTAEMKDADATLVDQCRAVIKEAKQHMARAQSGEEVRAAFHEGLRELINTLGKDDASV